MFERYTEHARRVIFFARYEASSLGSEMIEPEHLLLGLLREDRVLRSRLSHADIEAIRKSIESQTPRREKTSTSIDMPLSMASKRTLANCSEEAEELNHRWIDCGHMVLGLLRLEESSAAALLQRHKINYPDYRTIVAGQPSPVFQVRPPGGHIRAFDQPSAWEEPGAATVAAPALQQAVGSLTALLDGAAERLDAYTDSYGDQRLKRKPWSRKEALGHLIDWGTTHQQWFARALTETSLAERGYPSEEWATAQRYAECRWQDLVDLWVSVNRILIHVLARIPEEKSALVCRIGLDEPIPLHELVTRYVRRCEDILGQVLAHL